MRHVRLDQLLERQQRMAGHKVVVARDENRRQDWTFNPFVVIGIDADFFLFCGEGKLT